MQIEEITGLRPSEELRVELLKEEFRMRKRQPRAWTTKFRKYILRKSGR